MALKNKKGFAMYSSQCLQYFDQALAQAQSMARVIANYENKQGPLPVIESANKDQLKILSIDNQLYFQIKAPVFATAAAAYLKSQVDAQHDWRTITVAEICKNLDCPNTHRHQVQWVLESIKHHS